MSSESKAAPYDHGLRITSLCERNIASIPPNVLGKSMKLRELSQALDKHGIFYSSPKSLSEWVTAGRVNKGTGKIVRLRAARPGKDYESTILWAIEAYESLNSHPAPEDGAT